MNTYIARDRETLLYDLLRAGCRGQSLGRITLDRTTDGTWCCLTTWANGHTSTTENADYLVALTEALSPAPPRRNNEDLI